MSDFIEIATFQEYVSANIQKQQLLDNDIRCYVADENTITMQWTMSNALGGIRLMVYSDDFKRAQEILGLNSPLAVDHTIEGSDLVCPSCGSNNTAVENSSKKITAISWLVFGLPIKSNPKKTSRCFYCD